MDAKAEAEKRWRVMDTAQVASPGEGYATGFAAGAAWALREFGDLLEEGDEAVGKKVYTWASEAHHIADRIEEDQ